MAWRPIDRPAAQHAVVAGRRAGQSLAAAAAAAGVHVATVCRWQARDKQFAHALREAAEAVTVERIAKFRAEYAAKLAARRPRRDPNAPKPIVPVHTRCPACGWPSVVRRGWSGIRFWGCWRWPCCRWASWRPRCTEDCPGCGGPMYWSFSRLSVGCPRCQTRVRMG